MQEMVKLYESGNPKEAAKIHQRIVPVMKSLFAALQVQRLLKRLYS